MAMGNEIAKQSLLTPARVYSLDAEKLRADANHRYTKAATFLEKGFNIAESHDTGIEDAMIGVSVRRVSCL